MRLLLSVLLLTTAITCNASSINVGNIAIQIPSPAGYARITPEMSELYKLNQHFVAPTNIQLAMYISEDAVPLALLGEIPDISRRFDVQVSKKTANVSLSSANFTVLKGLYVAQMEKVFKDIKAKLSEALSDASKGVSKQLNTEIVIKVGGVVPLTPHFQSDRILSSSIFMKNDIQDATGEPIAVVISATMALVHVNNRVIFLYVYGNQEDLEWTREQSRAWAEAIVKRNI